MAKGIKGRALIVNRNEPTHYHTEKFHVPRMRAPGTLIAKCARCGEYFQVSTQMGDHAVCARGLLDKAE